LFKDLEGFMGRCERYGIKLLCY